MTSKEYHDSKALSKSAIDLLLECPALYKAWIERVEDRKTTPAMEFGTLVHTATLEPEFLDQTYAVCDLPANTKAGKEFRSGLEDRKNVIKSSEYESAMLMAEYVRDHPQAKHLFKSYQAERSIFWKRGDIECKARPDIVARVGNLQILADLKTCESASPEAIQKSIANYGYHRQAAWYLDGMEAVGEPCDAFIFIFVEKSYPHLVTMCQLDVAAIEKGRNECSHAVDTLKTCLETGLYPCYTRDILTISLPKWAA